MSAGPSVAERACAFASERRREICFACDLDGRVVWADEPTQEAIGARVAVRLASLACPGTEAKIDALLEGARSAPVTGWELCFGTDAGTTTFRCDARRDGDGVLVCGVALPGADAEALQRAGRAMDEIASLNRQLSRQERVLRALNEELSESNRGVLQLHEELRRKAEEATTEAAVKSRLVSGVSHEFRTPIHSILGLTRLLLDETDGPLRSEQRAQVEFIRASADELSTLVNDMLDLARLEAGEGAVHSSRFTVEDQLRTLRGVLRPLVPSGTKLDLTFHPAPDAILETDKIKVAQILRNLVANALKFTPRGAVQVRTSLIDDDHIRFDVVDTGMGIREDHLALVFEDFFRTPDAAGIPGTGLGLPLSRRLARLLGGDLTVSSTYGQGSTFTLIIPRRHPEMSELDEAMARTRSVDPDRTPVLVVEDDPRTLVRYEKFLSLAGFHVVLARTLDDARREIAARKPGAIVLDVMLEGESSWQFLKEVKARPETSDVPVLVVTVVSREKQARALGADEFWTKPIDPDRLARRLARISPRAAKAKVLAIDDDPQAHYILQRMLEGTDLTLVSTTSGAEGIALARTEQPDVILLDFFLDQMTAFDVIDALKSDTSSRAIPVIVVSSAALDAEQRTRLAQHTEVVLSKDQLSREVAIHRIREALARAGVKARAE